MATEDEILGLDRSGSSFEMVGDSNKAEEDLSCMDDDMLLLSSPSPSTAVEKSNGRVYVTSPSESQSKDLKMARVNVEDDELQIIDRRNSHVEIMSNLYNNSIDAEPIVDDDTFLAEEIGSQNSMESEDSITFMEGKINIFNCHGALLLWDADDVKMLREECRIVGKLTGCLPRAPRQNNCLGLPLQLMPEEVKLLVEIDAAVVVGETAVTDKTMQIRKAAFENVCKTNFKVQQKLYKENRREEVTQKLNNIIAGKKAKKQKLKNKSSLLCTSKDVSMPKGPDAEPKYQIPLDEKDEITVKDKKLKVDDRPETCESSETEKRKEKGSKDEDSHVRDNAISDDRMDNKDKEDEIDQLTVEDIVSSAQETLEKYSLVQIFTENPWKRSLRPCTEWFYPATDKDLVRYLVFKDLWGKGFYLTSGTKFGGDFLVYPGDPAKFHSHYIAICRRQHEEIPCLDLVSMGRLASNVRKTALLCALDKNWKVTYTSLQWTGMS